MDELRKKERSRYSDWECVEMLDGVSPGEATQPADMDWVGGQHCVEMRTCRWGSESRGSWIVRWMVEGRRRALMAGRSQGGKNRKKKRKTNTKKGDNLVSKCCLIAVRVRVFPKSAEETELGARRIQGKMNGPDTDIAGYMAREI
jgi:hypothetical protein